MLTPQARKRLHAIEEFSDLGSGLNIALQDLDIRGAGNLLGSEQSGFIADIGFETYNRILNEAILELKENEFKDFFVTEKQPETIETKKKFLEDCQIDTDMEILFPDSYISNISERIRLYRELDNIGSDDQLKEFEDHLSDRFGPPPQQVKDLLEIVRLRWFAVALGIEKIVLKSEIMILYFISDQESGFYKSDVFMNILNHVQKNPRRYKLKESKNKLYLTTDKIPSVNAAYELLHSFNNK
jgi:transcription-repair coupling factor (superfamily II helicase)